MYGGNGTMKQDSRRQFNNTGLSDCMANTGYMQQNPSNYAGHDDSINGSSSVRKSSKMDSIKAFVDANRDL